MSMASSVQATVIVPMMTHARESGREAVDKLRATTGRLPEGLEAVEMEIDLHESLYRARASLGLLLSRNVRRIRWAYDATLRSLGPLPEAGNGVTRPSGLTLRARAPVFRSESAFRIPANVQAASGRALSGVRGRGNFRFYQERAPAEAVATPHKTAHRHALPPLHQHSPSPARHSPRPE